MKVFFEVLNIDTPDRIAVVDITERVEEVVSSSGVRNGLCVVHVPHATAAVMLNEMEPRLALDYVKLVHELFKPGADWAHNAIDHNAHAHLAAAFIGSSRLIPVKDGRLVRGTWQNIILLELDGPRSRRVVVEVLGG
jgi:secondary thiamine-phosphate synthase enzyme